MHMPGAQVSKSMHPAAKTCTQGAGCTLKDRHGGLGRDSWYLHVNVYP